MGSMRFDLSWGGRGKGLSIRLQKFLCQQSFCSLHNSILLAKQFCLDLVFE